MKKRYLLLSMLIIPLVFFGSTGLYIILSPSLNLNNYPLEPGNYRPVQRDLNRYFSSPPLFSGGLVLEFNRWTAFVNMDLRQEFSAFLMRKNFTNIPLSVGSFLPAVDMNFPRLGYIERIDENSHLSIGRRKLSFGPSTYSFVLSDTLPYFDHFWLRLSADGRREGKYFYNFFAISADRTIYGAPKTLIGHRFGFMNDYLKISFGEQNLIYGVYPDLQDLGPFLIYHHTYQDRSNVTATLAGEFRIRESVLYGEFTLDDFRLKSEGPFSNPTAFGWLAGVSYQIKSGDVYSGPNFAVEEHSIKDDTIENGGGLNLRYEHYHSTTYLYNRGEEIGKFTYPYRFNVMWLDSWPIVTGFFGFPYGPDSTVDLLALEYQNADSFLSLSAEFIRRGAIDIDSPYSPPFDQNWYGLKEPITRSLLLSMKALFKVRTDTGLFVSGTLFFEDRVKFYMNLGFMKTLQLF